MRVLAGFVALGGVRLEAQKPASLVVISIDGMKPAYVSHAAERFWG
jgi:hypothetical protein